ncbi:MAG: cupin domain-containing protein [Thaumarchaeota archaeon]|nr:cupin domain-containing protein [Nitrososphaerota archaeon]MBI3116171.1 cupin domain-containing protein [Nitrososphaerota archaeon]
MSYKKTGYWSGGLWRDKKEAWNEPVAGVHRRILANSQTATLLQFRFEAGSIVAKHSHPHAQYGVCVEGGGDLAVGDHVWKVKQGDSWFIPPGVSHEYRNDPKKESTVIECFTPQREEFSPDTLTG